MLFDSNNAVIYPAQEVEIIRYVKLDKCYIMWCNGHRVCVLTITPRGRYIYYMDGPIYRELYPDNITYDIAWQWLSYIYFKILKMYFK